ncbi:ankyrin repeat domain-containing protein [Streptomyces tsukubensis]|uniref:ankyrin repeat domain-containing protein n=1 Tax=Streptomyces tsukubensis TaxID=83656 RepID=UPI00344C3DA4
MTELLTAVYEGDADAVARLLAAGAPADSSDEDGTTALYLAAVLLGDVRLVRPLLAAGADPERTGGDGALPLCGAAVHGGTEVVMALLAAGARPDGRESDGWTPLAWAVRGGHVPVVRILLEHGADPSLPAPDGTLPLVAAAIRGSVGTVRALLDRGAPGRTAALAEARARRGRDPEAELRAALLARYDGPLATRTRRVPGDDGVTVVVELLRNGTLVASDERGTGHAEIAALLEAEDRTPED